MCGGLRGGSVDKARAKAYCAARLVDDRATGAEFTGGGYEIAPTLAQTWPSNR